MGELGQVYQFLCAERGLDQDPSQQAVLDALSAFYSRSEQSSSAKRGFYLWGRVGRGKTMLMDLFYDRLDTANKKRLHFHELIREIRDRLSDLAGVANPLSVVLNDIAPPGFVLCLDEFHVSDVDNALVIELLLKELVKSRVIVITTSNFEPSTLIDECLGQEFIKNNPDSPIGDGPSLFETSKRETLRLLLDEFEIVEIGGDKDYRARFDGGTLLNSEDPKTRKDLNRRFEVAAGSERTYLSLSVFGRNVPCIKCSDSVIWLSYEEICEGHFSYRDYLELLRSRRLVILEGVKIASLDGAKRFGWLVEVVYDNRLEFVASAPTGSDLFEDIEIPPHLSLEFERIQSRVTELTGRIG